MNRYLLREDITDDIVIVKINRSYYTGISSEKLYDITRGCWKKRIESVERAKYALTVYKKVVVEVYKIFDWYRAEDEIRETLPFNSMEGLDAFLPWSPECRTKIEEEWDRRKEIVSCGSLFPREDMHQAVTKRLRALQAGQ